MRGLAPGLIIVYHIVRERGSRQDAWNFVMTVLHNPGDPLSTIESRRENLIRLQKLVRELSACAWSQLELQGISEDSMDVCLHLGELRNAELFYNQMHYGLSLAEVASILIRAGIDPDLANRATARTMATLIRGPREDREWPNSPRVKSTRREEKAKVMQKKAY